MLSTIGGVYDEERKDVGNPPRQAMRLVAPPRRTDQARPLPRGTGRPQVPPSRRPLTLLQRGIPAPAFSRREKAASQQNRFLTGHEPRKLPPRFQSAGVGCENKSGCVRRGRPNRRTAKSAPAPTACEKQKEGDHFNNSKYCWRGFRGHMRGVKSELGIHR